MTIQEIREKFPEESASKNDEQLKQYAFCSEILSDLFIEEFTRKKLSIDSNENIN